jgi:hypothetical protein
MMMIILMRVATGFCIKGGAKQPISLKGLHREVMNKEDYSSSDDTPWLNIRRGSAYTALRTFPAGIK